MALNALLFMFGFSTHDSNDFACYCWLTEPSNALPCPLSATPHTRPHMQFRANKLKSSVDLSTSRSATVYLSGVAVLRTGWLPVPAVPQIVICCPASWTVHTKLLTATSTTRPVNVKNVRRKWRPCIDLLWNGVCAAIGAGFACICPIDLLPNRRWGECLGLEAGKTNQR